MEELQFRSRLQGSRQIPRHCSLLYENPTNGIEFFPNEWDLQSADEIEFMPQPEHASGDCGDTADDQAESSVGIYCPQAASFFRINYRVMSCNAVELQLDADPGY
jgi:hypothetical protein